MKTQYYYRCFAETKYDTNHNPIMTTLFGYDKNGEKMVLIACNGWRNYDDMVRLYQGK